MPPFSQVETGPVEVAPAEANRAGPKGPALLHSQRQNRDRGDRPAVAAGAVPAGLRAGQLPSASPQTVSTMMAVTW